VFPATVPFEDLVGNFDDIEGPGNNSFLRWDADAKKMTVIAWDHNLAFGGSPGGSGGRMRAGEPPEGGRMLERGELPEDFEPPEGMPKGERGEVFMRGGPGRSNVLAERFRENETFSKLYDEEVKRLKAELFDDKTA
jgi:spore coat protein CotH